MENPDALMFEAEKKKNHVGWFGGNKMDEAADLYQRAANAFKVAKKDKEAADAFLKQAEVLIKINEKDEAANAYLNASKSLRKTNPLECIFSIQKAVVIFSERGRFQQAANQQKTIAEIYEVTLEDLPKALVAYEQAADWYRGEDSNSQGNACLIKVAHIAAQLEQYDKAVEQFESVAAASMDNNLTKWSVREYLLKAGICILCTNDVVRAKLSIEKYQSLDMTFAGTREFKFLHDLSNATEASDAQQFTDIVAEFDKMTRLDNWKTTLLLRIKKGLGEVDLL